MLIAAPARRLASFIATTLAITACDRRPDVVIRNGSDERLDAVVVYGAGFEASLGTLEPGAERQIEVSPRGESGLGIRYRRGDDDVRHPEEGYFEGNGAYRVTGSVTPELEWQVDVTLR